MPEQNSLYPELMNVMDLDPWRDTSHGDDRFTMFGGRKKLMREQKLRERIDSKILRYMDRKYVGRPKGEYQTDQYFLNRWKHCYSSDQLKLFERHLDMWDQSSVARAEEYFSNMLFKRGWHRTFVEKQVDNFTSKDGWSIFWQMNDTEFGCWVLRDPFGTDVESRESFWEFQKTYPGYEFFSKEKRYGRSGKTEHDIKFGPAHFPEGTVVEIFVDGNMKEPVQMTVDSIFVLGARNYLLTMKEKKPEGGLFGGEPEEYNLGHVRKIIKRGEGKVKLIEDRVCGFQPQTLKEYLAENELQVNDFYNVHPEYPRPKMRKGEYLFGQYDTLIARIMEEVGTHPDHYGKWVNQDRIFDIMHQRNFGRTISQFSPLNDDWMHFWIFDVQKLVDFMRKYQRLIFRSKDECEKIEDEIDKKNASELMYYHD